MGVRNMAEFTEEFYYEYPEGYEPEEFTEPSVRSLEELRADLTTDPETWKADLKATLTEMYLPAEDLYEQEEIKRKFRYRIEDPLDESPFSKEELAEELALITEVFDADRERAREMIESDFEEEVTRRALAAFHLLDSSEDYKPRGRENLLAGYKPAPRDEAVPKKLYKRAEALRKVMYQIDCLEEDEDLADMSAPFEILEETGREGFSDEDRQRIARDREHKKDLNRRFAQKRELQEELLGLANDMLDDEPLWQELDEDDRVEDRNAVEDLIQEILIDQAA